MKKGMPLSFPDGPLADHAPFALLPPAHGSDADKVCLVLTLVHSSFEPVPNADYVIPVEIDTILYNVYVCKRPGCDEFLERMGRWFEVVVFTASLAKYANPLLDKLDPKGIIKHRLFREACVYHQGSYVKDMSIMGRDIRRIIIVDNSPASFMFQPESALGCSSFVDQMDDKELWAIGDFLERLKDAPDVRTELSAWVIP
ncbi:Ctdsp1 [Symbiodinium sp. KB8]|nr:Ctdsp1 [Symbiodinium sp. KB8]